MKKSKVLSTAAAIALSVGMLSTALPTYTPSAKATDTHSQHSHSYGGSPIDLGIANDERLIKMLKDQGTIAKNATPEEAQKALNKFLQAKSEAANKEVGELHENEQAVRDHLQKQMKDNNSLKNGKGNKLGQSATVSSVEKENWDGGTRTDDVLVVLIDYPDVPHNTLTSDETDMYYEGEEAYSREHYQDMLFGNGGWKGPDGKTYVSMKQYYEQQSGGSYSVRGTVAGWYTASQPAAYYGGNVPDPDGSDARPRSLVAEALRLAAADPTVNLADYDKWDRYDLDGDGDYLEPDGLVDHLMVIHSGVGEEAGGGKLGGDAIWSHRWNLGGVYAIPGSPAPAVDYWGTGKMYAYDYTIEPEDGAVGVMAHEFGHDLGLPDEYDTQYTGTGEAVAYWSIMASGSWAGGLPGAQPTGFSPYMKEMLQASAGGNWQSGTEIDASDVNSKGTEVLLDEANSKGTNNDVVKVTLPDKVTNINTPFSGQYSYFSGSDNDLDNSLVTTLDLTNATSAELTFKAWYDIEVDWDYASVQVNGETVKGNLTTETDPHDQNPGHGITGSSNGQWVDAKFDLSAYAGQEVELAINYWTDVAAINPGLYVDDVTVTVDGNQVLFDDAEGTSSFELDGFEKSTGTVTSEHYYLLEWRSHNGVDEGLANIRRGASLMEYNSGLVVWYVDKKYSDNWTGIHPGDGFVGVVDADQKANFWSDRAVGSTRYQVHDAAFSLDKSEKMFLDYSALLGVTMKDNSTAQNPLFDDSANYSNSSMPHAGRNVPNYGLKFRVTGQSADGTVGKVLIFK